MARDRNGGRRRLDLKSALILIAIFIDAILIGYIRATYLHDHQFDDRAHRRAVAKPAPP